MIIKFKIFERSNDITITNEIKEFVNHIISEINSDIKNTILIRRKVLFLNSSYKIKNVYLGDDKYSNMISIYKGNLGGGIDEDGRYIFIYDTQFIKTLAKIDSMDDIQERLELLKTFDFSNIKKVLYHELIHRYDIIKQQGLKRFKKKKDYKDFDNALHVIKNDRKPIQDMYMKMQPEYNAFFLAAVNYMNDEIEDGKYMVPDNFEQFKKDFLVWLNYKHSFYDNSEVFRKKLNKRIYDLYQTKKISNK